MNVTEVKKLTTTITINFTGDVSGSATFDGSQDINIVLTINQAKAATTAALATSAITASQDAKGNVIDSTYATKGELENSKSVLVESYLGDYAKTEDIETTYAKSSEVVKQSELESEVANLNSASANKLSSAKKISLTGAVKGAISFDGSENVSMDVEFAENTAITAADLAAIFYF